MAAAEIVQALSGIGQPAEDVGAGRRQDFAGLGQHDRLAEALEQRMPAAPLEFLDVLAHARLGQVKFRRRRGEATQPCGDVKDA